MIQGEDKSAPKFPKVSAGQKRDSLGDVVGDSVVDSWQAMKSLRDIRRSVRGKLVGMVLLSTVVVLLLSGIAIVIHDLSVYRSTWAKDIATQANLLALSLAPTVAFNDREVAERNFLALDDRRAMRAAALYTGDGTLYAQYQKPGEKPPPLLLRASIAEGVRMDGERVEIYQRIVYGGEFLGTLYLRANYDLFDRLLTYGGIYSLIIVMSLLLVPTLSSSLRRTVSLPLEAIAAVAHKVVEQRDYSLRVVSTTQDEIDIVARAFNRMLDEVQARTEALEASNQSLRDQVLMRERAETGLARANARLESAMSAAEIGGWVKDLKSGELIVDRNYAALYGLDDEVALSTDKSLRRDRVPAEDRELVRAATTKALSTGSFATPEFRIMQPDGSLRWVIGRGRVQFDDEGTPALLAGLLIDVTAQKRAEEARRDSERVYRAIGESIDYGVWVNDAEGRNLYASPSFLKLTGMTQEQCSALGWGKVLHPDDAEGTIAAWLECVRGGQPWYREHRILGVDGLYHPVLAQGGPVRRDDGTIYAWAGTNLDISRIKQTEEALRDADRRKDEFLATLAHELRNPLAPIRNATHLLSMPEATEIQQQWACQVIAKQVKQMALLLDDLMDVSRITRKHLELRKQHISLAALIETAVETAAPLIDDKRHELQIQLPDTPVQLYVDPLRISQVLSNLLNNAAKYTDAGGRIAVTAEVHMESDPADLVITVSDNGIGLSEAAISRIFEMFSQVDTALDRSQGGLGIGLALAQGLVALHGGCLTSFSAGLGKGSSFVVRLPASAITPIAMSDIEEAIGTASGSGCRLLIADDNRDAADSLGMLLSFCGYEVTVAYSGAEVLDMASKHTPQAFILDIGMPLMNGYDLAQHIRRQPWGRGVKLIALTGWGQEEDVARALASGFDHHFCKPVEIDELKVLLSSVIAKRTDGT